MKRIALTAYVGTTYDTSIFSLTYEKTASVINQIPLSINSDGSEYVGTNGEDGYKAGYRLNSSAVEVAIDGLYVSGFIPIKNGDVIRMKNVGWTSGLSNSGNIYFWLYDSSFNSVNNGALRADYDFTTHIAEGAMVFDENNNLIELTPNAVSFEWADLSVIAYFRISAVDISENSIITVNQEIP